MQILALVPGGIGDQLLFFPTLDDIKRYYPQAQIDVVVEPRSRGAYRACKHFHDKSLNTLVFDFKDRNGLADWGNLLGNLRDRQYDAAMSLGTNKGIGFVLWLAGIPTRIGYVAANSKNPFLTNPIALKTEQYAAAMYHDLLGGFGIASPCPELGVTLLKEDLKWAETERQKLGIQDSGYIIIHGGSSKLAAAKGIDKIYPAENWQKIIQQLQERQPQLPIVLISGPDDKELTSQIVTSCPEVKIISPPDVGKLAAAIAGANLMVCTDSAPMHLAVAVQVYTIALFGPTEPNKLLPSADKFISLKSPTGKMADISPELVLGKILG